jgi:hypothetical protein
LALRVKDPLTAVLGMKVVVVTSSKETQIELIEN